MWALENIMFCTAQANGGDRWYFMKCERMIKNTRPTKILTTPSSNMGKVKMNCSSITTTVSIVDVADGSIDVRA